MNTQFYLKTPTGFEKIEIVEIDYEREIARVIFSNGDKNHAILSKIVQLDIHPVNFSK